jgi:hypothetical protein
MFFQVQSFWIFLLFNAALIQGFSFHSVSVFRLVKQPLRYRSQPKWIHKTNLPHHLTMREAVCFHNNESLEVVVPDLHSENIIKLKNLFLFKQIMNEIQKIESAVLLNNSESLHSMHNNSISMSSLDHYSKLLQDNKILGFPDNEQTKNEFLQRISNLRQIVSFEGQLIQQQTNNSEEISPNVSSKQNLLSFFKNQQSTLVSFVRKAKDIKWKELLKQVSSIIWDRPANVDSNSTAALDLSNDQRDNTNKTMKMVFDWFVDSYAKELKESLLIRKALLDSLSTFSPSSSPLIKYQDSFLQQTIDETGLSANQKSDNIIREERFHSLIRKLDHKIELLSKQLLAFRLNGEMELIFQELMSQLQNSSDPMDLKTIINEFIFLHHTLASVTDPTVHMISSSPSSSSTMSRLVSFLSKETDLFSGDGFDQKRNETSVVQDCADFISSSTQTSSTSLNESSSLSPLSLPSSVIEISSLINENDLISLYRQVKNCFEKIQCLFLFIHFFLSVLFDRLNSLKKNLE